MAKTDFCFTYYDGDAARDMQHMDRLTRGGYTDFILSQRKFGHLSIDFIRRILGKDFAEIWPQIEIVCRQDEEKKFFIEWLEISIQKASVFSKIQSERKSGKTKQEPNRNQTGTKKNLKGDGDENGDGYEVVEDAGSFGKSENLLIVPEMLKTFQGHNPKYPASKDKDYRPLFSIANYLCEYGKLPGTPDQHRDKILEAWEPICKVIKADKFYSQKTLLTISNHIQEILQISLNGNTKDKSGRATKEGLNEKFAARFGNKE